MGQGSVLLAGSTFLGARRLPLTTVGQASDGHDTIVTEIPDVASGQVWPGAYARSLHNRFIERWIGREGELRRRQAEVSAEVRAAYAALS